MRILAVTQTPVKDHQLMLIEINSHDDKSLGDLKRLTSLKLQWKTNTDAKNSQKIKITLIWLITL